MSLANTAVVGAIWTVASRLGSRLVSLIGTMIITRFLAPEVVGEVGVAVVTVLTAKFASDLAFGQFVVVKTQDDDEALFHAWLLNFVLASTTVAILILCAGPLGVLLDAPEMERYLPVMALSLFLDRMGRIPEAVALRELRFKLFSIVTGYTEVSYVACSLSMAAMGYGGDSIVWANVCQYGLRFVTFALLVPRVQWLRPCPLRKKTFRRIFRFGVPLAIGNVAHYCSSAWDRLVVVKLFGTQIHGYYGLAKGLSAVPADNIGDAVADVMMPSFVRMSADEARVAVVRASLLVAIIVFPLAAGLGIVAPTLVHCLFTEEWYGVATPLLILAAVSVVDPAGDTMTSYLKARDMPWSVMLIQSSFLGVILLSVFLLGSQFGLKGACFGVGLGMAYRTLAGLWFASRYDQVSASSMLIGLSRVALATGGMCLCVLGARELFIGQIDNQVIALFCEIGVGAIAYPPLAIVFARPIASDVLQWVRAKRRGESTAAILVGDEVLANPDAPQ